ncbi:unnamed protein product [Adineta ricciae]|uniref:Inosine/uridine-preferring nucleoside hydrolase domain-containing protein n=1 Tax=Adineta ricciae TaxID=249248 RepID=A0A813YSX4_ADIRI|nr:unnamed protein product [Adineta ricciae]
MMNLLTCLVLISSIVESQALANYRNIESCLGQNDNRNPVIIDTDADVDDLWAILYLIKVPTVNILAITTVGDGYSSPFFSTSNILSFLGLINCSYGIPVASGQSVPMMSSGWNIDPKILNSIDTYLTSPTCLNQSVDIFLQPSPFEAVELIIFTLKYSSKPVDILVLGPMTNIAEAIIRDRSIVPKIGTIYVSGGQFKSMSAYSSLIPNPKLGTYPYLRKTSDSSDNVFLDVLSVQRVDDSGVRQLVAMPSIVQNQLPTNLTQLNMKLRELNLDLDPFTYKLITSLAKCGNQNESEIFWRVWDNSAAQLMVQMQNNLTNGFCTKIQNVKSLYILSANADQLYGQGISDSPRNAMKINGFSDYKICTETNSDVFLTEFLTRIHSGQLHSCKNSYNDRFDIKLQQCLKKYAFN